MKLIDEKGKLFSIIHVFDLIFIIILVFVILGAVNKFSNGNLVSITQDTKKVYVKCTMETDPYRETYFQSIKIGDKLAEDKKYLEGNVTDIKIVDNIVTEVDNNGDIIKGAHPFLKKAIITFEVALDYKEPIYSMGKQEIRNGAFINLLTDKSRLSGTIINFEEINMENE